MTTCSVKLSADQVAELHHQFSESNNTLPYFTVHIPTHSASETFPQPQVYHLT